MKSNKTKIITFIWVFLVTMALAGAATITVGGVNVMLADGSIPFTDTATIDQNNDDKAIVIDSEATTASNFAIDVTTGQGANMARFLSTSSNQVNIRPEDSSTATFQVYRNVASATTQGPVSIIHQDNAGDDQNAQTILNDGTGDGLFVDANQGTAIEIDAEETGNYNIFDLIHNPGSAGAYSTVRIAGKTTAGSNYYDRAVVGVQAITGGTSEVFHGQQKNANHVFSSRQDGSKLDYAMVGTSGTCDAGSYGFYRNNSGVFLCENGNAYNLKVELVS